MRARDRHLQLTNAPDSDAEVRERTGSLLVIARSTCDEAIQTATVERFWIASLRSQ